MNVSVINAREGKVFLQIPIEFPVQTTYPFIPQGAELLHRKPFDWPKSRFRFL